MAKSRKPHTRSDLENILYNRLIELQADSKKDNNAFAEHLGIARETWSATRNGMRLGRTVVRAAQRVFTELQWTAIAYLMEDDAFGGIPRPRGGISTAPAGGIPLPDSGIADPVDVFAMEPDRAVGMVELAEAHR